MSKSIYEEALKESKDFGAFVGLRLDRVNNALEQAQKQEELLNKIKEIIDRPDDSYIASMLEESKRYYEIYKLIKELENDN